MNAFKIKKGHFQRFLENVDNKISARCSNLNIEKEETWKQRIFEHMNLSDINKKTGRLWKHIRFVNYEFPCFPKYFFPLGTLTKFNAETKLRFLSFWDAKKVLFVPTRGSITIFSAKIILVCAALTSQYSWKRASSLNYELKGFRFLKTHTIRSAKHLIQVTMRGTVEKWK